MIQQEGVEQRYNFNLASLMADSLPPVLLEACVVVGASEDKLGEICQAFNNNGTPQHLPLEPEVLCVLAPPFFSRLPADRKLVRSVGKKRCSFLRKKTKPAASAAGSPSRGGAAVSRGVSEDLIVPKELDLMALPQLCFPDGLQVTKRQKEEQFHFLVFNDVFGNKTHGVVMQCHRPVQDGISLPHNETGRNKSCTLFTAYSFCVISKYPYFTALRDCLSCLLIQLKACRLADVEEVVKEFAAKLALVPIPPPGLLHLSFTLRPLSIVLPSQEDKDHPAIDLDLHLPFFCFKPLQLLQVLSCLLQEQRVVLFSADWARLTLVAECFLLYLQPLSWQQPYVPVLARGMLDFLMVPTAFLMGCHLNHYAEVASETDDLVLVNIDDGSVSTSCSDTLDLPEIPPAATDCFTRRCLSLRIHFDLHQCHQASCTDISEQRAQRRAWQQSLNHQIQRIALELQFNIFRDVGNHLNYEHRVFNSEEFLKTREPAEQLFYRKVLETYIFHSFLKDRLNRKMDSYSRMEIVTRSEMQKLKAALEVPCRPTMQEIQARRRSTLEENPPWKRMGMSLPNLELVQNISFQQNTPLTRIFMPESMLRTTPKPIKVFKLPDFPVSLSMHTVQSYYSELILQLGKTIFTIQNENPAMLARLYFLRGFVNVLCSRRLDALVDFQNLYKTDTAIFPTGLVTWLVDSLHRDERQQADRRPELKRLIQKVTAESEKPSAKSDHVKKFELPRRHLGLDEFVRCVQECRIVKDVKTIHRLFDALTDGQKQQVDPELFRVFYTSWKDAEAEAQDVDLPSEVIDHLDHNECVYKLSSCVKTSCGVGIIAMTQKRLFLLPQGRPGFLEITKFRDIQEVKLATASFVLVRTPSLHIQSSSMSKVFEANLKTDTELWHLAVKEMWAGRRMADDHKDPQYMTQALTNVLLMDAVVGCLQTPKPIAAASKLAHFDKIRHEGPMTVPLTTSETLKHKINPSADLAEPQTVQVLLYTPGQLTCNNGNNDMNPKLWVALSGGRVVVFDASSWSLLHDCIRVGESEMNCMLGLIHDHVWMGSKDSIIYIIDTVSMSCNQLLTEHRQEVTSLAMDPQLQNGSQQTYSCSSDGTILQWDPATLKVKKQFSLRCERLSSIQVHDGALWCCCSNAIIELKKSGAPQRWLKLPDDLRGSSFSCFVLIPQQGQLWTGCADSGELCLWQTNHRRPYRRISLPSSSGITCMIRVKNQIWVGCHSGGGATAGCGGQQRGQLLVMDPESHTVAKELQAHTDSIQALCSAEDRYVLSGSDRRDGKIAIWKVE